MTRKQRAEFNCPTIARTPDWMRDAITINDRIDDESIRTIDLPTDSPEDLTDEQQEKALIEVFAAENYEITFVD